MIAVAHADGIIQTEEVAGIEKIIGYLAWIHRRPIQICMRERWPTRLFGSDRQTQALRESQFRKRPLFEGRLWIGRELQPFVLTLRVYLRF
jgi:hypothetical protein